VIEIVVGVSPPFDIGAGCGKGDLRLTSNMKTRIAFVALFIASISWCAAAVDRNGNGMSDVWEMIYGASVLSPNGDADGDGFSNVAEAIAGTNPFDPASNPRVQLSLFGPSVVALSWDGLAGKRYTIQSRTSLAGGSLTDEAQLIASGAFSQTNLASPTPIKFFRLAIDDVDSDGDGVSDYEERELCVNPASQHSDRYDHTDFSRITNGLSAASVVTVTALDPLMF
jgi:hypothetical protein